MNGRFASGVLAIIVLGGCSVIPTGGNKDQNNKVYLLETVAEVAPAQARSTCTVVVSAPEAAPGFSGPSMYYMRTPKQIERFAFSRWAESPASMLEPLLRRALLSSREFSAVLPAPAAITTDLRIESDELRLVQVFSGKASEVQLSMSSRVYAPAERGLLATREFRYVVPADAAGPEAGVAAADRAVAMLLSDFAAFARDAIQSLELGCSPLS